MTIKNDERIKHSKSQCCLCGICLTYEHLPTIFWYTIFCPIWSWSLSSEHLLRVFGIRSSLYELLHTIIWHTMFFFTNFRLRSFGVRSFALYDHFLTNICLRTFDIRALSLGTFFLRYFFADLSTYKIIFLRAFACEPLAYERSAYELLSCNRALNSYELNASLMWWWYSSIWCRAYCLIITGLNMGWVSGPVLALQTESEVNDV